MSVVLLQIRAELRRSIQPRCKAQWFGAWASDGRCSLKFLRTSKALIKFSLSHTSFPPSPRTGFLPLESPIRSQNDVNEFFALLLDRLGKAFPLRLRIPASPTPSAQPLGGPASQSHQAHGPGSVREITTDVFSFTFTGTLMHQMIGELGW